MCVVWWWFVVGILCLGCQRQVREPQAETQPVHLKVEMTENTIIVQADGCMVTDAGEVGPGIVTKDGHGPPSQRFVQLTTTRGETFSIYWRSAKEHLVVEGASLTGETSLGSTLMDGSGNAYELEAGSNPPVQRCTYRGYGSFGWRYDDMSIYFREKSPYERIWKRQVPLPQ